MTSAAPPNLDLLENIDAYLDAVPRSAARGEAVGSLTVFVREIAGWPYYARPTPGAGRVTAKDVRAARARQRGLGIPETFEWIVELSPEMRRAASATGLDGSVGDAEPPRGSGRHVGLNLRIRARSDSAAA
jgi:hypothetical protein